MKIICSINGIDGVGKTTQVDLFRDKYGMLVETIYGLEAYEGFPKLTGEKLHKWWFEESSINEFCDAMYESLNNRNKSILNSEKKIIVLDKGIINFESRIKATLKVRGFKENEVENAMNKSKEKIGFKDIENVKILIKSNNIKEEKIKLDEYNNSQIGIYTKYEIEQVKEIDRKTDKFDYIVDYKLGIEEINKAIRDKLINFINNNTNNINVRNSFCYMGDSIKYIDLKSTEEKDYFKNICRIFSDYNQTENIQIFNYDNKYCDIKKFENYKEILIEKSKKLPKIENNIKIKELNDYRIPEFYKNIIINFSNELKSEINNLKLILIHGSAGRECMHENWSDLDFIICVEKYNFNEISKIAEIIKKYKDKVKIGSTIYSKLELESLNVDAKTLYALYQMQRNEILPILYKDIDIPLITHGDLINKNLNVLPEAVHKLKRLLYNEEKVDKETIIKTLNLIMKVILISNNMFGKAYEEIFEKFSNLYNIERFEIEKYLRKENNDQENKQLIKYARKVIELIINKGE